MESHFNINCNILHLDGAFPLKKAKALSSEKSQSSARTDMWGRTPTMKGQFKLGSDLNSYPFHLLFQIENKTNGGNNFKREI